jgi:hypothetical protein
MSDMDSAQAQDANPGDSGQANSPGDSQAEVISALTDKLNNIEGQLNSLRSEKDKGISKTNKRLSDFEARQEELILMQQYVEKYGSPEAAAREIAIDAMLQGQESPQAPAQQNQQQPGPAGQEANQPKEDNLVSLLGVSEKDPAFVALVSTGMSPNDAAVSLATQRNQANTNVPDNAASGISGGGMGTPQEGNQQTVLEQEYRQRLGKIRQGDFNAIGRLKDEMRGKGYEVY